MKKSMIIAAVLMLLVSCTKNKDNKPIEPDQPDIEQPVSDPIVTEPGQSAGVAVQKTIGPSGGTITSADGNAQLVIPAGALDQNQTITLQPIESKLPGSMQKNAYRIGPANLPFKQDAELVVKYTSKEIHEASPELMQVAAHQSNGKWKRVGPVVKNKTAKTLSAKIRRTWDYTPFLEYHLEDNKTKTDTAVISLLVGEKVEFSVTHIVWDKDSTLRVPLIVGPKEVSVWQINGEPNLPVTHPNGHFEGEEAAKRSINYVAPVKVPAEDTVSVSAQLLLGSNRSIYLLVRQVAIVDQNRIRIDGRWYNAKAGAIYTGGLLMITLGDISNPSKPVNLNINMMSVTGPGTYSFSDATVVTFLDGAVTPVKGWESYYTDIHGKRIHAGGSVTITAGGIQVGQPLEGRVEGELLRVVNSTTGQVERVAVYGSFGVILGG
ncbi:MULTISPECIES: hypothetical protein [Niastella]|uniref:ZU5 domain-containing protein n=1 Tax=Niastella soli TaxID=2821487 RepID=A0ABS3Z2M7_9BACT|nr:hypothetical protein [Niastella soli]MBO9204427.1 hypothetical protein [Niastella soli]